MTDCALKKSRVYASCSTISSRWLMCSFPSPFFLDLGFSRSTKSSSVLSLSVQRDELELFFARGEEHDLIEFYT